LFNIVKKKKECYNAINYVEKSFLLKILKEKKMKKILWAILICAAFALSVTACGGKDEPASTDDVKSAEKADYQFEIIVKSFQSTYWQAAVKGVEQACKEQGVTAKCNGPVNESDIDDQLKMLEDAIEKAPDGIGLAACDTQAVFELLQKALDAGIPVVCFDTGVDGAPEGSVVATIATDNIAAGACAAENMYPVIKDVVAAATTDAKVRIGEVNQDATALNIQQRGIGFIDRMIELITADGKKVAVEGNDFYVDAATGAVDKEEAEVIIEVAVPAQTTVELSAAEAQKIMAKDDMIAIFGSNQTTVEGIINADNILGKLGPDPEENIIAAGFDAGIPQKDAIINEKFIGSVTQDPLTMGYECINALVAACKGEEAADIPMEGRWYNKENMEDEDIAPNLYN